MNSNPNHFVVFRRSFPEFQIASVRTSRSGCYSESTYHVTSYKELDADDFTHLDAAGLLGFGQSYRVTNTEALVDEAKGVTQDRRTGQWLPEVPPVAGNGEPCTATHPYDYWVYTVVRSCDSGD